MNYLDILLAIPLLWAAYKGFKDGLIIELASLAALVLGIYGAIRFSDFTAGFLLSHLEWTSEHLSLIAFAITFILIVVAVHLLARMIDKLLKAVALGLPNRLLGALFGVVKVGFILSILLVVVNTLNRTASFLPEEDTEKSVLYGPVSRFAPSVFPYLHFEQIRDRIEFGPAEEVRV